MTDKLAAGGRDGKFIGEAWLRGNEIIVGIPFGYTLEAEHNCDQMGCGAWHVLHRFPNCGRAGEGSQSAPQPFGYAYRYADGIRFDTGGREINGSMPIEVIPLYRAAAAGSGTFAAPDVDKLAQVIREVDGGHKLGAGALAEAIIEKGKVSRWWAETCVEAADGRGFAAGIEAAARWCEQQTGDFAQFFNAESAAGAIRALAQEKREPAPATRDFEDIKQKILIAIDVASVEGKQNAAHRIAQEIVAMCDKSGEK